METKVRGKGLRREIYHQFSMWSSFGGRCFTFVLFKVRSTYAYDQIQALYRGKTQIKESVTYTGVHIRYRVQSRQSVPEVFKLRPSNGSDGGFFLHKKCALRQRFACQTACFSKCTNVVCNLQVLVERRTVEWTPLLSLSQRAQCALNRFIFYRTKPTADVCQIFKTYISKEIGFSQISFD